MKYFKTAGFLYVVLLLSLMILRINNIIDVVSFVNLTLTAALVVITGCYAYQTQEMVKIYQQDLQLKLKNLDKPPMERLVKNIINPFVKLLRRNEEDLRKRYFSWDEELNIRSIFYLDVNEEDEILLEKLLQEKHLQGTFERITKKYNEDIQNLDKLIITLIQIVDNFDLKKMVNRSSSPYKEKTSFRATQLIIDNLLTGGEFTKDTVLIDFLKKEDIQEYIRKVNDNKEIKEIVSKIKDLSAKLENDSKNLRDIFLRMRESYGNKYGINVDEKSSFKHLFPERRKRL